MTARRTGAEFRRKRRGSIKIYPDNIIHKKETSNNAEKRLVLNHLPFLIRKNMSSKFVYVIDDLWAWQKSSTKAQKLLKKNAEFAKNPTRAFINIKIS